MRTETGLYIIHNGKRVEVYNERELKQYYARKTWWAKAAKLISEL